MDEQCKLFNELCENKSVFVPFTLIESVLRLCDWLNVPVNGGAFDLDNKGQYLYLN